jgi:hypothetical protein
MKATLCESHDIPTTFQAIGLVHYSQLDHRFDEYTSVEITPCPDNLNTNPIKDSHRGLADFKKTLLIYKLHVQNPIRRDEMSHTFDYLITKYKTFDFSLKSSFVLR